MHSSVNQLKAQEIQWGVQSKTTDRTIFFATDSINIFNNIYNARQFLYDSLSRVASKTESQFQERVYTYNFQPITRIRQLVISFPDAGRYIYYIKAKDAKGIEHVLYEYSGRGQCDTYDWLIITVPPIGYAVHSLEIGTFQKIKTLDKLGLSQYENVNDVLAYLIRSKLAESYCVLTTFTADKEKLPMGTINSQVSEVKPIISADGNQLYFHRQQFKGNIGGSKDEQDIYSSAFAAGQWNPAINLGSPINNKYSNGIAGIMPGENGAFLINEYKNNSIKGQGVSFSQKELNGWSMPEKVIIEDFYNNSQYFDFCITVSMGEMILAIDRTDGWGDQDLYVSRYNDESGKWSAPENLGEIVNTPMAEVSPYLAADGKTLYFASEGHLGYGGFDLFITKRLDNSWTNWSQPENLGPIVNSDEHDLYYSVSALADYAYFSSGDNDNRDIFRIPLPKVFQPEPVTIIEGFTIASDSSVLASTIKVFDQTGMFLASAKSAEDNGFYRIVIPADSTCTIQLFKSGQLLHSEKLHSKGFVGKKILSKNFIVSKNLINQIPYSSGEEVSTSLPTEVRKSSSMLTRVINGKIVNGSTLRPLGTRLLYYKAGNVISRSLSNPLTGEYQVVLTGELPDSIKTMDSTTGTFNRLPSEASFMNHLLIKIPPQNSDTVRLGSNLYRGIPPDDIKDLNNTFKKRKRVGKLYYGVIKTKTLHPALTEDLSYVVSILKENPETNLRIIISCESDYKKADQYRETSRTFLRKKLQEMEFDDSRIEIIQEAPFIDRSNTKKRINTGIWLQIVKTK